MTAPNPVYQHLILETGRITRLTLNRPPLNVFHLEMLTELQQAFKEVARSKPALVVLAAAGRAFCAGVDVADHTPEKVSTMLDRFHRVFRVLESIQAPLIALVQGAALGGGCELVSACDLVLSTESATFGQPEIRVGVFPPVAAVLLPTQVGRRLAAEMLLTGEPLKAQEARDAGLVNHVYPDTEFQARSKEFILRISRHSGAVLALTKQALRLGRDRRLGEALPDLEALYLDRLMETEDAREGIAAFMERRPPVFRDR